MGARNVCLMTDKHLSRLPPVKAVLESLAQNGVNYKVYDNVRVEPTDTRYCDAPRHGGQGRLLMLENEKKTDCLTAVR